MGHREKLSDKLILATGSFPFVPPIPGNDQEHCHVYRTIEDLDAIESLRQTEQIGRGDWWWLTGLEAANALRTLD
ncbi:FAD-dependent oxidoreductase [Vibrio chagasii]|nr:FAD-dependent oxidoreductase [Vibrio chagasii]